MKSNKKKKKLLGAAAALALLAVISGTFAWLTAQDQRVNRAESAAVTKNAVKLLENWEPNNLRPGASSKKEVKVTNTGKNKVFVRASFEEVLKHLEGKGAVQYDDTGRVEDNFDPAANNLGKTIPVDVDIDELVSTGGYEEVTGTVTNLPAGCKMYAKGGKYNDGVTSGWSYNDEYQIVYEYATGLYQDINADIAKTETASTSAKEWDFTLTNIKYGYYTGGYKYTVANWADSTLPAGDGTTVTKFALLGTKGNRYSVAYDYETTATGLGTSFTLPTAPGLLTAAATDQYPIAGSATVNKGVQADKAGLDKNSIRIQYGADLLPDTSSLAAKKWVYNPEDGWFYYTEALAGGQTTPHLMDKLIFDGAMGVEYTKASYDLVVKMEAIQATPEALTDSSTGWGMVVNDAVTKPNSKAIYDYLNQ